MSRAVAGQTELGHAARNQHARVGRPVRCMTGNASFRFHRSMFENKRALLVDVTFEARGVGARRESGLFKFEAAVWIVAIAALHGTFQHFVMEGHKKLVLLFAVAAQAQLRFARLEQFDRGNAGFLRI